MKIVAALLTTAILSGCSIEPVDYTYYADEAPSGPDDTDVSQKTAATKERSDSVKIDAYKAAVEQVLQDYKGKMNAREGYTFVPPVRQDGVRIPGRKFGHSIVLPTTGSVLIAPGYYVDEATVYLPGGNNESRQ